MEPDKLVLTSFRKALEPLEAALAQEENEFVRDATIQCFEYTCELAWKMIRRHLEWAGSA